ncbi:MAG TPA: hypothetical protein VIJ93_11300 [bacterium]
MHYLVDFINLLFQPYTYFAFSVLGFWAMIHYREKWTEPKFAMKLVWGVLIVLILSLFNDHFRDLSSKADNVPIFLMVFSVGFFTWLSIRQGVVNDRRISAGQPPVEKETSDKKVYVWPDLVYIEFIATIVAGVLLLVWSLCLHAPLEQAATPAWTPNPSKAPWYFLGLQEMLVYYDPWLAGVVFPSLIIVGLMAIPYIDRNPKGSGYYTFNERKFAIIPFLFGFLILWVTLIFLGTFLRGPGWNFYGPFEDWNPHKVVVLNNVNLSEYFWVKLLGFTGLGLPKIILLRELPGFVVLGLYFIALPPLLTKKIPLLEGLLEKMGIVRYGILMNLMILMAALPIKMLLRWAFNLKYIVGIPEFFFNI